MALQQAEARALRAEEQLRQVGNRSLKNCRAFCCSSAVCSSWICLTGAIHVDSGYQVCRVRSVCVRGVSLLPILFQYFRSPASRCPLRIPALLDCKPVLEAMGSHSTPHPHRCRTSCGTSTAAAPLTWKQQPAGMRPRWHNCSWRYHRRERQLRQPSGEWRVQSGGGDGNCLRARWWLVHCVAAVTTTRIWCRAWHRDSSSSLAGWLAGSGDEWRVNGIGFE